MLVRISGRAHTPGCDRQTIRDLLSKLPQAHRLQQLPNPAQPVGGIQRGGVGKLGDVEGRFLIRVVGIQGVEKRLLITRLGDELYAQIIIAVGLAYLPVGRVRARFWFELPSAGDLKDALGIIPDPPRTRGK